MEKLSKQKIIDLYTKNGLTCREIAYIVNKSDATIYKILTDNSVELRDKSEANKIFSDKILIFLYNLGLSYKQVSKILGINPATISKRFTKLKFSTRTLKNSKAIRYTEAEFNLLFYNQSFINFVRGIY